MTSKPLPVAPRYGIGDRVYAADLVDTTERVACPDCLGKKTWACTTPAGEAFELECPTCSWGYEGAHGYVSPHTYTTRLATLTIGSVRIDTNDREHPVEYMCEETGVGSGSIWYEERLAGTREEAEAYARDVLLPRHTAFMADNEERNRKAKKKDARRKYKSWNMDELREACLRHALSSDVYRELTGWQIDERMNAKRKPKRTD